MEGVEGLNKSVNLYPSPLLTGLPEVCYTLYKLKEGTNNRITGSQAVSDEAEVVRRSGVLIRTHI